MTRQILLIIGLLCYATGTTRAQNKPGSANVFSPGGGGTGTTGGGVTSVATGNGLQGGPITTTGTVDLRLNASGGLSKVLGTGGNELGIAAGGVSLSQIQNIATNSLLGRYTAGTGAPEVLTIGTGLAVSSGVLSATAASVSPGGTAGSVQYTDGGGSFLGSARLTWDNTNVNLTLYSEGTSARPGIIFTGQNGNWLRLRAHNLTSTHTLELPNDPPVSTSNYLKVAGINGATYTLGWADAPTGSGGPPGGATGDIQWNDGAGSFAGVSRLNFDGSSTLSITSSSGGRAGWKLSTSAGKFFTVRQPTGLAVTESYIVEVPGAAPTALNQVLSVAQINTVSTPTITLAWTAASGGSSITPGGTYGHLQYNNGTGGFAGGVEFSLDPTNSIATLLTNTSGNKPGINFTTANGNSLRLRASQPSSSYTIETPPDPPSATTNYLKVAAISGSTYTLGWADAPSGGSGGSTVWSALTAPTQNLTLAHSGYISTFTWGSTGSNSALTLSHTNAASTGNLLRLTTNTASNVKPLSVEPRGLQTLAVDQHGNVTLGAGTLATTDVNGYPHIPSFNGIAVNTPTTYLAYVPLYVDSESAQLRGYVNSVWQSLSGPVRVISTQVRELREATAPQTLNVYGTADSGAASPTNYTRLALKGSTASMTFAAESGGTGAANLDLKLLPKGTGGLVIGQDTMPGARLHVVTGATTQVGGLIQLMSGATGNAFEVRNSASLLLAGFDATGKLIQDTSNTTTTATVGTITPPASCAGYLSILINGVTKKICYYNQ